MDLGEEWSMVVPSRIRNSKYSSKYRRKISFYWAILYYVYERYLLYCSILVQKFDNKFNGKSERMSNSNNKIGYPWSGKITTIFSLFFRHTFLFLFLWRSNFQVWNIDSKNGILYRILKISSVSCKISSRVYFDELFRVVCQEGELIFERVKGIFKFEMWFIDRRESVSLCLPGCSSLKFDVLWQGYTSFDDTRFSIPRFIFLLHCYLPSVFFEEKLEFWKKTCSVWKIQIQKYRENEF